MAASSRPPSDPPDMFPCAVPLSSSERSSPARPSGKGLIDPLASAFRSKDRKFTDDNSVASNLIFGSLEHGAPVSTNKNANLNNERNLPDCSDIHNISSKPLDPVNDSINLFDSVSSETKHVDEIAKTAEINKAMNENVMQAEVFQQGSNKSPGLDGSTSSFFKFYWDIVKDSTWRAVKQFFTTGCMNGDWKDTMIVLIPKINSPLIYEEQVAYVPGRSMSDHCLLSLEIFNKFRISKNKKGYMAVKLDMDQYFDRTRWIEAKSGFRQGCPMSPYLFIMCSQLLSSLIEQRGLQIGIQTSSRAPKIMHLLYADDILLFGSATTSQLHVMMSLINEYCGWIGQGINQNKSQIIFGNSFKPSLKRKLGKKSGFKTVKELNYLVIKIALRRLVKNDFHFVIDHALEKLNSWGARFLSIAGRLTLAKSSLLSLPTFVYSLIPKKILYELDRICRDFIWHQNSETKGLHYIAWHELCIPRASGGLGMHSSVVRVGPLRARLAWRLYQNPTSLLFRCLTAKYGSAIWSGKTKKGHSAAHSIISNGVSFLKPIVRWNIVNGANISVMNDIWLLDKCFNKWPTLADCIGLESLTLQNFILDDGHRNLLVLSRYFNTDLVNLIIHQCVIHEGDGDYMELLYQHSGKSITSLAYSEAIKFHKTIDDYGFANWLWKLKLKPRMALFWWRLSRFAIPTNEFLKYRKLSISDHCAYGCPAIENCDHILIHCKSLSEILCKLRSWGIIIPRFSSLTNCFQHLKILSSTSLDTVKLYRTAVYYSWNCRNDKKHCNPAIPVPVIDANVLFTATSKFPLLVNWDANLLREFVTSWHPPPLDWIKINVDSSLLDSNLASIGGVARDSKGCLLLAFGRQKLHWDINQLEMEAVFDLKDFVQDWKFDCK
ncbi:uncharacterized protein LOC110101664 [Dendrobium catenatum]|uniref:uncharacterized protein LOC110101664 n=1 Tax=Dendrobium catenatum TaxID=906689 RepID=UPI0009F4123A|nr:uncharacterized protein LOC110101664 [Dendrobium catenatum]